MYEAFYGLTDQPFNITPDPKFLYLSESHKEGLAHLLYGIERKRGITVLIGEVGVGKTTLLNCLMQRLDKKVHIALLVDPKISSDDIYPFLLTKFGLVTKDREKSKTIIEFEELLLEFSRAGESSIFIIDEAHHLSDEVLEQIEFISNFETSKEKLIQIVLVGQQELENRINSSNLMSLRQRIGVVYQVRPLDTYETKSYIEKRLSLCGASQTIFTPEAIEDIYHFSRGIPRLINVVCDLALVFGCSEEQLVIGRPLITEAAMSLNLHAAEKGVVRHSHRDVDADRADAIVAKQAWGEFGPPNVDAVGNVRNAERRANGRGRRVLQSVLGLVLTVGIVYILITRIVMPQHPSGVVSSIETISQSVWNWFTGEQTAPQE
jgi:general secretion pathway protein A